MELSEALARTSINRLTEFDSLGELLCPELLCPELLCPELIQNCLQSNGVATLRKRKLPMESMVWAVIGMALFRGEPVRQLINKLDIILPNEVDYVARSAVTQARKKLGSDVVEDIFRQTQQRWNMLAEHPQWCGLNLYGVDGVVWRTPDTPENEMLFLARVTNRVMLPTPKFAWCA